MSPRWTFFGLLLLLQPACATLGQVFTPPTVTLQRVDIERISFSGIAARFIFSVENPNPIGLDLARLGYQITIDGHQLAEGRGDQPLAVPARGTGELALPVEIKFVEFAESLAALFEKDIVPYGIRTLLGFSTPAGVIEVNLAKEGTFPVPRLPDIRFDRVLVGDVSLGGATLSLGLKLGNRNGFSVPIGALRYAVAVEGVRVAESATSPMDLAANATRDVDLSVHVNFLSAGISLARAIQSGSAQVTLTGGLDLGGFTQPINLLTSLR
jgi:LEA14-like dessication related protein